MVLAEKAEGLEAKVAQLEGERRALQEEVESLRSARSVLEAEIATEQSVSAAAARASWEALDRMEGAMRELGAVPPPPPRGGIPSISWPPPSTAFAFQGKSFSWPLVRMAIIVRRRRGRPPLFPYSVVVVVTLMRSVLAPCPSPPLRKLL